MARKLYDLARMTCSTVGTGATLTLVAAVSKYITFTNAGVADGEQVSYGIRDGLNTEVGTATWNATPKTLTGRTPSASTNGGAAINLSGNAQVYICARAADLIVDGQLKSDGSAGTPALRGLTDPTSGLYFPATQIVALSSGGLPALWAKDWGNADGWGNVALGGAAISTNRLLVISTDADSATDAGIINTVQFQRWSRYSGRTDNPACLRVYSRVDDPVAATEWAVSGILDNYTNAASLGNAAVSGVANKFGTASCFGGHFLAWDTNAYAAATDVTAIIGAEFGVKGQGLDHPTSNNNLGARFCLDVIPRNQLPGTTNLCEVGAGIRIRLSTSTKSTYRYGLVVDDIDGFDGDAITTAIAVRTHGAYGIRMGSLGASGGAHTTADISLEANSAVGLQLTGSYSTAAIKIAADQPIILEGTNTIKMQYTSASVKYQFFNGANDRVSFLLNAAPALFIAGTQVVASRKTGWGTPSGTLDRTTLAAFAGQTINATYNQTQVQNIDNAAKKASQVLAALITDLRSHGIIGT